MQSIVSDWRNQTDLKTSGCWRVWAKWSWKAWQFLYHLRAGKKKNSIYSPHKHTLREEPPLRLHRRENKRVQWGQMECTNVSAMNVTQLENVLPPDSGQGFLSDFILCAKDWGPLQRTHFSSVLYLWRFCFFNGWHFRTLFLSICLNDYLFGTSKGIMFLAWKGYLVLK